MCHSKVRSTPLSIYPLSTCATCYQTWENNIALKFTDALVARFGMEIQSAEKEK